MKQTDEDRAIRILSEQIRKVVSKLINSAGYDKTVPGIITGVEAGGKYKVKIKNEVFTLPSSVDMEYKLNEGVWVTIPQNNLNNKFISGRRIG